MNEKKTNGACFKEKYGAMLPPMWILCCQISTNRNGVRNCFHEDWSSRYIGEDWVCWLNQPRWSTSYLMEKCRLMDKYTQDCKLMSIIISEEQGKMEHDLSRKFQWYLLLLANPSNQPSYQWICLFLILKKGGKRKKERNLSNQQLTMFRENFILFQLPTVWRGAILR